MKPFLLLAFSLALSLPVARAANVTAQDKGASIVLDNGTVSIEINKQNGNVLALNYHKTNLLAKPAYLDWQTGKANHIGKGET